MRNHRTILPLVVATAGLLLGPAVARGQSCPTRASWPTLEWPSRVDEYAAARSAEIAALEDYAFTLTGEDSERKGIRTDSVLIVQGGAIVYEKYARGFDETHRHLAWSVTKSVTNALIGIAVMQGSLALEDSICDYVEPTRDENCDIRVVDLLEMASGLDWNETYEGQSNQESSTLAMFYGEGHADMAAFVLGHPNRDPPGTSFMYSTGDAMVLGAVSQGAMQDTYGELFPWDFLFDPLGMDSAVLERDMKGHIAGGSYFYGTPRDYARFGFLFLNDGCWDGERILPESWVHDSTQVNEPFRTNNLDGGESVNGRCWWLNVAVPEQGMEQPWPAAPDDTFAALGHWGQSITVIPSLDMVIVRTADDRDDTFERNEFYPLAIDVGREL